MADSTATVLSDTASVRRICGVNDRNLVVLEQLFGSPVWVRGNELSLGSDHESDHELFASVIEDLQRHPEPNIDASLIRSSYKMLRSSERERFGDLSRDSISIGPGGTTVVPRSHRQRRMVQALDHHSLNFFVGPAGTGKTYIAVAYALREVLQKRKRRLVLTRPVVEAGERLGFLPGDLTQKISPYLRPLYDAIEALIPYDMLRRLDEQNVIEIAPLAYMRGRSLRDAFIILDEAQNTTRAQMKMFLTRLGEQSQAVVTGDVTQIDLPRGTESGLQHAVSILEGIDDIAVSRLDDADVVRSALVQKIVRAYDA